MAFARVPAANQHLAACYSDTISPLLMGSSSYALLDFPAHCNIGDLAIYLGELCFLDQHFGKSARYVASIPDYKEDLNIFSKDDVILIHGGGNFGDLWPKHHHFRLELLRKYPNRTIVQLPQSLHFEDGGILEETKRAIGQHNNFTLCVRDKASKMFAEREFDCPVVLSPDAAHCINTVKKQPEQHDVLSLVRSDKETAVSGLADTLAALGPVVDWPMDELMAQRFGYNTLGQKLRQKLMWRLPSNSQVFMGLREKRYRLRAQALVDAGTDILSKGKTVISDRLHAHILCLLLGKKHISLDNTSGKISAYIEAWGGCGITEWAASAADVRQRLAAMA